jgi:hypothetical protein
MHTDINATWDREDCVVFGNHCCCEYRGYGHEPSGVGWIIFAMVMFIGAAICFSIAAIAFHLWVFCQIGGRLLDRQWFRAIWWTAVLLFLFYIDGTVLIALDAS